MKDLVTGPEDSATTSHATPFVKSVKVSIKVSEDFLGFCPTETQDS